MSMTRRQYALTLVAPLAFERTKLVVEGAAAAPVGALLHGLIKLPPGSRVAAVLSGGNVNLQQLRGLTWN